MKPVGNPGLPRTKTGAQSHSSSGASAVCFGFFSNQTVTHPRSDGTSARDFTRLCKGSLNASQNASERPTRDTLVILILRFRAGSRHTLTRVCHRFENQLKARNVTYLYADGRTVPALAAGSVTLEWSDAFWIACVRPCLSVRVRVCARVGVEECVWVSGVRRCLTRSHSAPKAVRAACLCVVYARSKQTRHESTKARVF